MYRQFFKLFILIAIGYTVRKCKLIDDRIHPGLNKLVLDIAYPCMVFVNILSLDITGERLLYFAELAVVFELYLVLCIFLSRKYWHLRQKESGTEHDQSNRIGPATETSSVMPNAGFLGYPVSEALLGAEGLFYMITINIATSVTLFGYAESQFIPREERAANPKWVYVRNALLQPVNVATFLGVILAILRFTLPPFFSGILTTVGSLGSPLAMIYIGSILAGMSLRLPKREVRPLIEGCVMKLLVFPALAFLLSLVLLRTGFWTSMIARTAFITAALPSAALITTFAANRGGNARLAGWFTVATTVLSLGTIPFWLAVAFPML